MAAEIEPTDFISNEDFEELIVRFSRLAVDRIKRWKPKAPDRAYVENSAYICWENSVFFGDKHNGFVTAIEDEFRIGSTVAELIEFVFRFINRLPSNKQSDTERNITGLFKTNRDVFKYLVHLFTLRRIDFQRNNHLATNVTIVATLPKTDRTIFDSFLNFQTTTEATEDTIESNHAKIPWLGTQSALAALLVTLKEKGWIEDYKPYKTIINLFTNSKSIDQYLRPAEEDGKAQHERILKKDFLAFENIRPNRKAKS